MAEHLQTIGWSVRSHEVSQTLQPVRSSRVTKSSLQRMLAAVFLKHNTANLAFVLSEIIFGDIEQRPVSCNVQRVATNVEIKVPVRYVCSCRRACI